MNWKIKKKKLYPECILEEPRNSILRENSLRRKDLSMLKCGHSLSGTREEGRKTHF